MSFSMQRKKEKKKVGGEGEGEKDTYYLQYLDTYWYLGIGTWFYCTSE